MSRVVMAGAIAFGVALCGLHSNISRYRPPPRGRSCGLRGLVARGGADSPELDSPAHLGGALVDRGRRPRLWGSGGRPSCAMGTCIATAAPWLAGFKTDWVVTGDLGGDVIRVEAIRRAS